VVPLAAPVTAADVLPCEPPPLPAVELGMALVGGPDEQANAAEATTQSRCEPDVFCERGCLRGTIEIAVRLSHSGNSGP
jgi:hypothetical protein